MVSLFAHGRRLDVEFFKRDQNLALRSLKILLQRFENQTDSPSQSIDNFDGVDIWMGTLIKKFTVCVFSRTEITRVM